jgi:hypothetical protein
MLAHLVPSNGEFSPASDGLIGLVEGQAASPRPLAVSFKPLRSWQAGTTDSGATIKELQLSAQGPSVRLLRIGPVKEPMVWESAYLCGDATSTSSSDPLAYIQTISPPALSLLKPAGVSKGGADRLALQKLATACGAQVSREQVIAAFEGRSALGLRYQGQPTDGVTIGVSLGFSEGAKTAASAGVGFKW